MVTSSDNAVEVYVQRKFFSFRSNLTPKFSTRIKRPATLRIGTLSTAIDYAPLQIALEKNWLTTLADKIALRTFESLQALVDSAKAGEIDLCFLAEPPAVAAQKRGAPIKVISLGAVLVQNIIVRTGSGIQCVKDLAGKSVAVLKGSSSDFGLRRLLEQHTVSLEDINIIDASAESAGAMFRAGTIDAWAVWPPHSDAAQAYDSGKPLPLTEVQVSSVIAAHEDFLQERQGMVTRFMAKMTKAKRWIVDNPESAKKILARWLSLDKPVLDLAWQRHDFSIPNDHHLIIADLSFSLKQKEFVSILGPSGCGKTTLLRMISGLDNTFQGHMHVANSKGTSTTRGISIMFQEPRLLPWKTVSENVAFGSPAPCKKAITQLLAQLGIAGYAHALPRDLSGGMAQRVALARALISKPQVLLLDEPFGALDPVTRLRLHELLHDLTQHRDMATLMVTHDVEEAVVLSDRILVMNMGPASIIRSYDVARIGLADRDTKPFFDVTTKIRKELSAELGFE